MSNRLNFAAIEDELELLRTIFPGARYEPVPQLLPLDFGGSVEVLDERGNNCVIECRFCSSRASKVIIQKLNWIERQVERHRRAASGYDPEEVEAVNSEEYHDTIVSKMPREVVLHRPGHSTVITPSMIKGLDY